MSEGAERIEPGTILAGRYRVERRLGEGGMGSVFLVQHVHTDQQLALKVLHSTVVKDAVTLDRFRREARTPARINSDHVVQVTDADVAPELGGVPFLVMEWLRGEDLSQLVSRRGPLPRRDVVLYLQQAARALDKAHDLGIIHRDLKPENLFLTTREDGAPWLKLLDFGIAKLTGASGDLAQMGSITSTGQVFGTPLYMSPEQARAELSKISPKTDVWAIGLIAHKLLTGNEFWSADTLTQLLGQIAYEPMPSPSSRGATFGEAYDAWFMKCCAREPDLRYESAGEATSALAEALAVTDLGASGASDARPSASSISGTGKRGASIAFAETAVVSPSLSASEAPMDGTSSSAGSARDIAAIKKASRARIAIAALWAVLAGCLGIWISRGSGSAPVPSTEKAVSSPALGAALAPSSAETAAPVMVTPSPGVAAPSALSTASSGSSDTRDAQSARGASKKEDLRSGAVLPARAGGAAHPSAPAAVLAAPKATVEAASPPATTPPAEPQNPLSTRH